jgi:hypothetical protein
MTHTYHFQSNRPAPQGVFIEARLKDAHDNVIQTLRFPDPKANFWVQHRQDLLAQWLAEDLPVMARPGEVISGLGQQTPTTDIWEMNRTERVQHIKRVANHLIPRDQPVSRPSPFALQMAKAYARYLRRTYGAAKVELLRHSREPIGPEAMFGDGLPPAAFEEQISSFGEFTR